MKAQSLLCSLALGAAFSFSPAAFAKEHHHHDAEMTDALFVKKAATGGLTEVELGKLASQNGDSQDVKDFGSKMVTDHSKANDDLKATADKDKMTLPDKPTAAQQAMIDKLSKESGKAFDTAYIHAMVKAHMADRDLFTEESASTKNPDLKQFADNTLTVIKDHLSMIEGIADSHGMAMGHKKMEKSMDMGTSSSMTPAPGMSDAAQSKSGAGPGGTGSTMPDSSPAMGTSTGGAGMDSGNTMAPTMTPSSGDAGQSKSGPAPGGNANPMATP